MRKRRSSLQKQIPEGENEEKAETSFRSDWVAERSSVSLGSSNMIGSSKKGSGVESSG